MFLSIVIAVSLDRATIAVEHPEIGIHAPAIIGKPASPTPAGFYLLERAHSRSLGMNVLIFRRDDSGIYAIHPNLKSRAEALRTKTPADNRLSAGCIGVDESTFAKLWNAKQTMILQVY